MSRDLADHAIRLAEELGAPVFPVLVYPDPKKPGKTIKKPLITAWQAEGSSRNPDTIRATFAKTQCARATHVGVVMGDASGLLLVDIDGARGQEWMHEHMHLLPPTRRQRTQRDGGLHLYYRIRRGLGLKNSASGIAPGVDIRADGGFALDWSRDHAPQGRDIADAPAALIELLRRPVQVVQRVEPTVDGVVVEGARNVCLSREAYRLRRLGLSVKQIAPVLLAMNNELCSPPLPGAEVRKIAKGKERIQPDRGVARRVGEILFMSGSHVKMEPINWVWNGWLACGAFHLLGGAPGAGKTTVLLKLAATVTAGMTWPDGTRCEPGNVFIWSGEDRFEDTLLPRLVAMGGDRSRFYYISALSDEGEKRSFDPANDVAALADALDKVPGGIAMLIVDPVIVIAKKDSHKNAETRSDLQPLVDLAKRHSCIAIGNTHFTKGTQGTNPVDRITGSLAFAAAARTVMVCARVEGSQERLFLNAKGNNRKETGGGFAYSIETRHVHEDKVRIETSAVEWGELLQGEARDLLNRAEGLKDGRSHDTEAMQFLRAQLADGPKPIKDIVAAASEPGYSRSQLNRARERLRVLSDGVCWTDPVSRAVIAKLSKSAAKKGRV